MKVLNSALFHKHGLGAAVLALPMFALPTLAIAGDDAVVVKNTASNPVPVTGTVSVTSLPPVSGTVNVTSLPPVSGTVTIAGTPTVNVNNLPPVTVTTTQDPTYFVVPYALDVTAIDHFGVTLTRPAILESIATTCNGSLIGTHFQVTTDFMATSATAFDPPPTGTKLVVRNSQTGVYTPATPSLNYPPYGYQNLLDYPSLTTDNFSVTGLNLVVLTDVNVLGPAFNPGATYCWGYFLFRKI